MLMMLCCIRYYVKISLVKFIHIFCETLCFQCNLFFKISAISNIFVPLCNHFCRWIQKLQKISAIFPNFGNVAEIRNAFPNSEAFTNSKIFRADYRSAVWLLNCGLSLFWYFLYLLFDNAGFVVQREFDSNF